MWVDGLHKKVSLKKRLFRRTFPVALGLGVAFAGLGFTPLHSGHAEAATCRNTNALGTHREIAVSRKHGFLLGTGKTGSIGLRPGEVVLTFDDGPRPGITDPILDALKAECVQATFYMLGRAARAHPRLVKRVAREGHTVAAHTQTHPFMTRLSNHNAAAEVRRGYHSLSAALKGTRYKPSNFFRYPYLDRSQRTDAIVRSTGMIVFDMYIDSLDYKKTSAEVMLNRVLNRVRQRGSGVILFHDIQKRTARAMPAFLRALKAEGYKIVHTVPAQRNFKFGKISTLPDIVPSLPRPRPEPTQLASIEESSGHSAEQTTIVELDKAVPAIPLIGETVEVVITPQAESASPLNGPESGTRVDDSTDTVPQAIVSLPPVSDGQEKRIKATLHREGYYGAHFRQASYREERRVTLQPEGKAPSPVEVQTVEKAPSSKRSETLDTKTASLETPHEIDDRNTHSIETGQGEPSTKKPAPVVDLAANKEKPFATEVETISDVSNDGIGVDPSLSAQRLATASLESSDGSAQADGLRSYLPFPVERLGPRVPLPEKRPFNGKKSRKTVKLASTTAEETAREALLEPEVDGIVPKEEKPRRGFFGLFNRLID